MLCEEDEDEEEEDYTSLAFERAIDRHTRLVLLYYRAWLNYNSQVARML